MVVGTGSNQNKHYRTYSIVQTLMHTRIDLPLPTNGSPETLATFFRNYFEEKTATILCALDRRAGAQHAQTTTDEHDGSYPLDSL